MSTESFNTSSGKEVTVNISDAGEPESVTIEGVTLSENEIIEINEWIEDYGNSDDDDDNDDDDETDNTTGHELT